MLLGADICFQNGHFPKRHGVTMGILSTPSTTNRLSLCPMALQARAGTAPWPDHDSAPALSALKTRAHRVRAFLKANDPYRGSFRSYYFFDGSTVASFTFDRILRRCCAVGLISINAPDQGKHDANLWRHQHWQAWPPPC